MILKKLMKNKIFKKYSQGLGTIIMLHRVSEYNEENIKYNEHLKVSPKYLEETIIKLKQMDYEFISLDELYIKSRENDFNKKFVVFTLDDGYKDNFENAYPIFKKYDIPFCIYISSSFIDKTAILWWYMIEEIILKNNEIVLWGESRISCQTSREKEQAFLFVREKIISLKKEKLLDELKKMLMNYNVNFYKYTNELTLELGELKELLKDKLVTIGFHTKNHFAMKNLSEQELLEEVVEAKKELENLLNIEIKHFSYPFGSRDEVGEKEMKYIKNLTIFQTACTTRNSNIHRWNRNHLEGLPRIFLSENCNLEEKLFVEPMITNRFSRRVKN